MRQTRLPLRPVSGNRIQFARRVCAMDHRPVFGEDRPVRLALTRAKSPLAQEVPAEISGNGSQGRRAADDQHPSLSFSRAEDGGVQASFGMSFRLAGITVRP